ncbi:hypothetical protein GCM10017786_30520 [Amycolatopsis deserti]|uniref:Uncharacterized protein n=1 Tax=Amycolatopsis deserti TaxID=185696 RepID=A0ABQ3IYL2_9PSEU|nr:hypothetical protein GCM10017786_30520 [Amycolatopsis deserti]
MRSSAISSAEATGSPDVSGELSFSFVRAFIGPSGRFPDPHGPEADESPGSADSGACGDGGVGTYAITGAGVRIP